jgi:hypothetical protein
MGISVLREKIAIIFRLRLPKVGPLHVSAGPNGEVT